MRPSTTLLLIALLLLSIPPANGQNTLPGGFPNDPQSLMGRLSAKLSAKGWGKVAEQEGWQYLPQAYQSWFKSKVFEKVTRVEALSFMYTHADAEIDVEWLEFPRAEDAASAATVMDHVPLHRVPYKPPVHWHWMPFRNGILMVRSIRYPVSSLEFAGVLHVVAQVVFEMRKEGP